MWLTRSLQFATKKHIFLSIRVWSDWFDPEVDTIHAVVISIHTCQEAKAPHLTFRFGLAGMILYITFIWELFTLTPLSYEQRDQ